MITSRILSAFMLGLLSMLPSARAQSTPGPQLDYSRIIQQSDMVFVPYVGMDRGPIYYTSYEQVPTEPGNVGQLRKLVVNLFPTAHKQNLYNGFVSQHGVTDARLLPALSPEGACQPSAAISNLLAHMPPNFRPKILGGNYPIICSLSLFFLQEDQGAVLALINTQPVISFRVTIPLCVADGPRLDVAALNQKLLAAGALQATASGVMGDRLNVLFESVRLAQAEPALFVTPDPRQGWDLYMKAFTLDLATQTMTMTSAVASEPIFICTPLPLVLQFGWSQR